MVVSGNGAPICDFEVFASAAPISSPIKTERTPTRYLSEIVKGSKGVANGKKMA
jgi:hypothetical protein